MLLPQAEWAKITQNIKAYAEQAGLGMLGVAQPKLSIKEQQRIYQWLRQGMHGEMHFLRKHAHLRCHPHWLVPGAVRVLSVQQSYLTEPIAHAHAALNKPSIAYISRYALGQDYHRVMRKKLVHLAQALQQMLPSDWPFLSRACVDSAPVPEVSLARQCGRGWRGKHTLLLQRTAGSFFFLGNLFVNTPLPIDPPVSAHCGSCRRCLTACPTQAIIAPYRLDARRCIAYLTIEHKSSIPEELRPLMGNRIYGCDDCQLVCPWNKFAKISQEIKFQPKAHWQNCSLLELFQWNQETFLARTQASPIRRIGYRSWLRNLAVALGNAEYSSAIVSALQQRRSEVDEMVAEHIDWAYKKQMARMLRQPR